MLVALAGTIRACEIPMEPFADLLVAFRQDQTVKRYATWEDMIGLLPLFGESGRAAGALLVWI